MLVNPTYDLLEWPEGELVFEHGNQKFKTNPDIFFAFFDWVYGEISHMKEKDTFTHDIWGVPYDMIFKKGTFSIFHRPKNSVVFHAIISLVDFKLVFKETAKELRKQIILIKPEIDGSVFWKSFCFLEDK